MNEVTVLLLAGIGGALLGTFFFVGLWWTVQKGLSARHAALWFLGSMLLRSGLVLAGFYFISRGDWRSLVVSLIGFIAARSIVTASLRRRETKPCA